YRRISGSRAIREIYIGYERERSTIFAYPRGLLVATASSVALLAPSSGGRAPQCPGAGASRPRLRAPYQIDQLRSAADTGSPERTFTTTYRSTLPSRSTRRRTVLARKRSPAHASEMREQVRRNVAAASTSGGKSDDAAADRPAS